MSEHLSLPVNGQLATPIVIFDKSDTSVDLPTSVTEAKIYKKPGNASVYIATTSGEVELVGSNVIRTDVSGNTGAGVEALYSLSSGTYNTAVGYRAGRSINTGISNTALGYYALYSCTLGADNVAIGLSALRNVTIGLDNTATGYQAGFSLVAGSYNTLGGYRAGYNCTGSRNTLYGYQAGSTITTELGCVCLGDTADIVAAAANVVSIGRNAKSAVNGVTIGYYASTGSGSACTIVGGESGLATSSGAANSSLGYYCFTNLTTGAYNTGTGAYSLSSLTTGSNNVANGYQAGQNATEALDNTFLGYRAGQSCVSGIDNIAIGSGSTTANYSNSIVIGKDVAATASNQTTIGTTSTTQCILKGVRGITTGQADAIPVVVDSKGQLGTVSSSARYKENIVGYALDRDMFNKLRPVTFNYLTNEKKRIGLIAEEVAAIYPDLAIYQDGQIETVDYLSVIPILISAIQDLYRITTAE